MRIPERSGIEQRVISRRHFVQGVAVAAAAGFGLWRLPEMARGATSPALVLTGNSFDLTIKETPVNFTRRPAVATAVNGIVPGPILRWREGDTVRIAVTNHLREFGSIHWHGSVLFRIRAHLLLQRPGAIPRPGRGLLRYTRNQPLNRPATMRLLQRPRSEPRYRFGSFRPR